MIKEIGILVAAGKGERLRPVTLKTPKPMVKVNGTSMIETIINGLEHRGITEIYVIVGYLKEAFNELAERHPNITFVENTEFMFKNNISSIHALGDIMGKADCFLCEADLKVSDPTIFDAELNKSCYYGKMVEGHSDDWVFDQDANGRITRIGKYGDDQYNMCGVCYLKKEDAITVREAINEAYKHPGHENLFWDQILNECLDKVDMTVHPVLHSQIVEIDTYKELCDIDPTYIDFE